MQMGLLVGKGSVRLAWVFFLSFSLFFSFDLDSCCLFWISRILVDDSISCQSHSYPSCYCYECCIITQPLFTFYIHFNPYTHPDDDDDDDDKLAFMYVYILIERLFCSSRFLLCKGDQR
jgi:hypothetical protein